MKALVTGVGGQDGTYLCRELLERGRMVTGLTRHPESVRRSLPAVQIRSGDWVEEKTLWSLLEELRPEEIYHLASPSCIRDTREFENEILSLSVQTTQVFLHWIVERSPQTRIFFAGSSEVFGDPVESPQHEATVCRPENPYAVAKLAGGQLCEVFRARKGVFASVGILFNHESPLRRADFVSRRITQGVAAIAAGQQDTLSLGNLDAVRDWSHAADFARAFRLTLEAGEPADFVLASGTGRTVREFCETAFAVADLDYRNHVVPDAKVFRSDFAKARVGQPTRAERLLGWKPQIGFAEMVREMVSHDLALLRSGAGP